MSADARQALDSESSSKPPPQSKNASSPATSSSMLHPDPTIPPRFPPDSVPDAPSADTSLISSSGGSMSAQALSKTQPTRDNQIAGALESYEREVSGLDYFTPLPHLGSSVTEPDLITKEAPVSPDIARNSDQFVEAAREELYGDSTTVIAQGSAKAVPSSIISSHNRADAPGSSNLFGNAPMRSMPVRSKTEHPQFPNQSLAALHTQFHPARHFVHFSHNRPASSSQSSLLPPVTANHTRPNWLESTNTQRTSKTAGNTPTQTPGLFPTRSPNLPINPFSLENTLDESSEGSVQASPYLHPAQQRPPRTVTSADRGVDTFSGRKIINHYEIMTELGRGVHGKVKLARDLETGKDVAIKIVSRYSKRTRLGKPGIPEDKVKKEIAILKKIQHPNVVRLIEVIDDPDIAKVYLVLEFCELKEIRWRHSGYPEIILAEHHRQLAESQGLAREDQDAIWRKIDSERRRKRKNEARRKPHVKDSAVGNDEQNSHYWSLEYAEDTDDESYVASESALSEVAADVKAEGDSPSDNPRTKMSDLDLRKQMTSGSSGLQDIRPSSSPTAASLHSHHGSSSSQNRPATSANTVKAQDSEGIIDYFDSPRTDGFSFYSTEWYQNTDSNLRGPTLDQIHETRNVSQHASGTTALTDMFEKDVPEESRYMPTMSIPECRAAFRDALVGIEYLHYQGIVHRDIKPENLLRNRDRRVKISDFGVSYLGKPDHKPDDSGEVSEAEGNQFDEETALAKTVGTPAFYAPELCNLEMDTNAPVVTGQIDVWALGVTLFCLLFARTPFTAENQFALMRKISEDEVFIPRLRLKAVDPLLRSPGPDGALYAPDKRLADQWKHEAIDDELYDLLNRVLEKNPQARISIRELKHHPWVLKGLGNPAAWLDETEPANFGSGEKIEISNEEVAEAVIPIKLVERIRSITKRATSALGLGARRRRGQSSATSSEISSANIGEGTNKERRRQSLQANDPTFSALKLPKEKEPLEHPLAHSVTASPSSEDPPQNVHIHDASPHNTSTNPELRVFPDSDSPVRPGMPDRQISELSTSASIRTVRQSDYPRGRPTSVSPPPAENSERSRSFLDTSVPSSLSALFNSAGRSFLRTLSRDGADRASTKSSPGSRNGPQSIGSEAPVAHSIDSASDHVDIVSHLNNKLGSSQVGSMTLSPNSSTHELRHDSNTTQSSSPETTGQVTPSSLDHWNRHRMPPVDFDGGLSRDGPILRAMDNEPTDEEYHKAIDDLNRRRVLEDTQNQEHLNASRPQSSGLAACPPSPDDESPEGLAPVAAPHREYFVSHFSPSSTAFSSEDHLVSDRSRSTSHPSDPSIVSANSSAPPETASDHYIDTNGSNSSSEATAGTYADDSQFSAAEQHVKGAESDDGYAGDGDGNDEEVAVAGDDSDNSSDSDEDFLLLQRHKSKTSGRGSIKRGESARRADADSSKEATESGSTNTIK